MYYRVSWLKVQYWRFLWLRVLNRRFFRSRGKCFKVFSGRVVVLEVSPIEGEALKVFSVGVVAMDGVSPMA